jgi:hypothetical protein
MMNLKIKSCWAHFLIGAWITKVPKMQAYAHFPQPRLDEVFPRPLLNPVKGKPLVGSSAALLTE